MSVATERVHQAWHEPSASSSHPSAQQRQRGRPSATPEGIGTRRRSDRRCAKSHRQLIMVFALYSPQDWRPAESNVKPSSPAIRTNVPNIVRVHSNNLSVNNIIDLCV